MKKLILVGIMFLMFMGVVSAASKNGSFEGNPIVEIYSNAHYIKYDDVPAIIFKGRTMVPLYLLKKMGAEVTWNQENYAVSVEFPTKVDSSQNDIATIKMYSKVTDHYRRMGVLGDIIAGLSNNFSLSFSMINSNNKPFDAINAAYDSLKSAIDNYNSFIIDNNKMVASAGVFGINIQDTYLTLNEFSRSIDYYKLSYASLDNYRLSKSDSDFQSYLNNGGMGFDTLKEPRGNNVDRYTELYNILQNY